MHKKACVVVFRSLEQNLEVLRLLCLPERGGGFAHVTGSVEKAESFKEGAQRELLEETGFDLTVHQCDFEQEFLDLRGRKVKERGFWALVQDDQEVSLDGKEHCGYEWVPLALVGPETFHHESHFRAFLMALKEVQE
jgi:8-oxo-dGTP pyrophosphatase MutT (NUDIX family)